MRIALISRRFDTAGGGTERDLVLTARILSAGGHRITIYADEVRSDNSNLTVRRVRTLPFGRALKLLSFGLRAAAIARRDGAELVMSFARATNADIVRSGGGAHSSYVRAAGSWQTPLASAAMRLSPYHRAQIALEQASFKSAYLRCAVAVSDFVRRDLRNTFDLDASRVFTLYNGVDLNRFVPNHDRALARQVRHELGIPENLSAVAFVGHGFARKGLRFLLEAWPLLDTRACLVVAGADRSATAYRNRANQMGIGDRIIFVGPQSRIERLFAAVDALALPSLFEPFGNVVMEAMAAGLPVLCSKQCGVAELMPTDLRELVVEDPSYVEELARRVNLLVRLRGDASQLVRAAAEQYTWERHGAELLRIISVSKPYPHRSDTMQMGSRAPSTESDSNS